MQRPKGSPVCENVFFDQNLPKTDVPLVVSVESPGQKEALARCMVNNGLIMENMVKNEGLLAIIH